jgi:aerobic carbon-monoxide dehydrogenase small subunit
MQFNFYLNAQPVTVDVLPDITLLALLREHLGLTGTKCGCGVGECGACSIILDGEVVNSCLVLAPQVAGRSVLTIEGFSGVDGGPGDLQQAFIDAGAVQCGFCTPGMVLAAAALLQKYPRPTRREIAEGLAGNLCRCTGYQQIIEAVQLAARRRAEIAEPSEQAMPDVESRTWKN